MASAITDIVMAAANLKAAAPSQFKIFCDTLKGYEAQCISEALIADAPEVFRAQGRAKAASQLRKHITECHELRDSYTKRA